MNDPASTTWPASSARPLTGMIERQLPDLFPGFFRMMQPLGGKTDIVCCQRHAGRLLQ
jgi:hypothetical protein